MSVARLAQSVRREAARQAQAGAIVAFVTLYLSLQILLQPNLLDFLSTFELAGEWLAYLGELAVLAAALTLAYIGMDALSRELADGDPHATVTAQAGSFAGSWGCDANGDGVISAADRDALGALIRTRTRAVRIGR